MPAGTSTSTTELLGLHPSGVRNQECTVISNQLLLQLHSAVSIDVLGVVRDDGFGDSLADGVYLRSVSTTLDTHTDVEGCEGLLASDENGLVDLETEDFGLDEVDGGAVDADETTALLGVCYRSSGLDGAID